MSKGLAGLLLVALSLSVTVAGARNSTPGTPALLKEPPLQSSRFDLSVESIMRGPKLVGYAPSDLRWSGDSKDLYFEWRHAGEDSPSTYVVDRTGASPRKLTEDERRLAPGPNGVWDDAHKRVLFEDAGDIVLVDSVARTRRQITRTTGREQNPRWARRGTHVTFTRDNNLFIVPVEGSDGAVVVQLTDVSTKKPEPKLTDSQKMLKEEDQKLIEFLREAEERRKKDEQKTRQAALPRFDVEDGQSVEDMALAPDDTHVFMLVVDKAEGSKVADVPNYVTQSAYPEMIPARTNVGDSQERRRLAVMNVKTGKTVWATREGSAGESKDVAKDTASPDPVRWNMPAFSPNGEYTVASADSEENKNRWLVVLDQETGQSRVIDHLHDDAWVNEVGPFGNGGGGFMPDNWRVWFLSERDGWMHLYVVDLAPGSARPAQLTTGRFEVSAVELSADKSKFYLVTSQAHPGERQLYSLPIAGGSLTRLTTTPGAHSPQVSPDDSTIGDVFSYSNKPPELYLLSTQPGSQPVQATTSTSEEWRSFKWVDPELVTFKARDGVDILARLYTPEMMGARRDPAAPGVVFVHGAGYLQNAHRYWSYYYREYMFHNLLTSRGYVVLDVDYRGSAGYGRDWRTAIYRHMGGTDLNDIVDGARFLTEKQKVSPKRIGVYGGSYGGFITLMAMFTSPSTFAAGAALRPVTDWAHYNHPYTSNILNEPQKDLEAYRRSSPIYFAEGLKGALLICHGMVDTNVLFQDSVRLAQRLIELRKENWELAVFPVENHGFERETSWSDEYKRILKLFEENLRKQESRGTD